MFGWFKRARKSPAAKSQPTSRSAGGPAQSRNAPPTPRPSFLPSGPAPLPEVLGEGNTEAEWSQWEDSVMSLDSQMQDLAPTQRVYVRDTRPSKLDEMPDAFSNVRRKRDV